MKLNIYDRALEVGKFVVDKKTTVRKTASKFNISKSTVHQDLTIRLNKFDPLLYEQVRAVLDENKALRHIRGGEATKQKHLNK